MGRERGWLWGSPQYREARRGERGREGARGGREGGERGARGGERGARGPNEGLWGGPNEASPKLINDVVLELRQFFLFLCTRGHRTCAVVDKAVAPGVKP